MRNDETRHVGRPNYGLNNNDKKSVIEEVHDTLKNVSVLSNIKVYTTDIMFWKVMGLLLLAVVISGVAAFLIVKLVRFAKRRLSFAAWLDNPDALPSDDIGPKKKTK
jgi:hypothetical protein